MGGYGSGQRWSKKGVVEGRYTLDTTDLKKMKLLVPGITNRSGSLHWRRGNEQEPSSSVSYTLTVGEQSGTFTLGYQLKASQEKFDYSIRLVTTGCHLGGRRWWFICPLVKNGISCGRRVRKLYLCGKYFGCRHCHDLTFTSTQESDSRVYAALRGGLDLDRFEDASRMSISRLGFALKVLTFEQKRLDKWLGGSRKSAN